MDHWMLLPTPPPQTPEGKPILSAGGVGPETHQALKKYPFPSRQKQHELLAPLASPTAPQPLSQWQNMDAMHGRDRFRWPYASSAMVLPVGVSDKATIARLFLSLE